MSNTEDPIITQYEAQLAAAVVPDYFLPEQFCNNGTQTTDYVIPPKTSADPAAASLDTGAPPLQQVKPSLGGAVFPRQQYNGILRLLSNLLAYLNKGNNFTFDTKNTDGYALGAVLFDYNSNKWVVSLKNANKNNFVTNPNLIDGINWQFITVNPTASNNFTVPPTVPTLPITDTSTSVANMADINQAVTGYTSIDVSTAVGGVLTITEAQYRLQWIGFTGTLTSDLIIEFPRLGGKTIALSNSVAMGSYNITMRMQGQSSTNPLYSGVSYWILTNTSTVRLSSFIGTTQQGNCFYNYDIASNDNSYRLANTAFVQGLAALMGKLASNNVWSGQNTFNISPTVPAIAGTTDSTTKAAPTSFVQQVAALKAPLASPAFTGTPTAPTAPFGTNTTQLATMAALAARGSGLINATTAINSYDQYSSGRIIQRGAINVPKNNYIELIFPIAFPTACLNFQCTASYSDEATDTMGAYFDKSTLTTTGVSVSAYHSNPNPRTLTVYWTAIGY